MSIRLLSFVSAYVVTEATLLVAPDVSRWPLLVGSSLALLVAGEIFLRWTRRPVRREPGSRVMISHDGGDDAPDESIWHYVVRLETELRPR